MLLIVYVRRFDSKETIYQRILVEDLTPCVQEDDVRECKNEMYIISRNTKWLLMKPCVPHLDQTIDDMANRTLFYSKLCSKLMFV